VDECLSSPCVHGECLDLVAGYQCICDDDRYTGRRCELERDPCRPNQCQNAALCVPTADFRHFTCRCQGGFTGKSTAWMMMMIDIYGPKSP
jgi:hypothetical protein